MSKKSLSNIHQARLLRGFSQEEVAKVLGVSRPTYINIEKRKKELTITQAKMLSSMLRISLDDIVGDSTSFFSDVLNATDKYKQIIINSLKYGAASDGKITKTKLAKLVYLADFIWYYNHSSSMSGATYRKLPRGPVADVFFRALDEMEESGTIIRQPKRKAIMLSLTEDETSTNKLSDLELEYIKKISQAWQNKSTDEIVDFTHQQLPWQICREGEVIPYGLISQEDPERVYGAIKL